VYAPSSFLTYSNSRLAMSIFPADENFEYSSVLAFCIFLLLTSCSESNSTGDDYPSSLNPDRGSPVMERCTWDTSRWDKCSWIE